MRSSVVTPGLGKWARWKGSEGPTDLWIVPPNSYRIRIYFNNDLGDLGGDLPLWNCVLQRSAKGNSLDPIIASINSSRNPWGGKWLITPLPPNNWGVVNNYWLWRGSNCTTDYVLEKRIGDICIAKCIGDYGLDFVLDLLCACWLAAIGIEMDQNLRFQKGWNNSQKVCPKKVGPLYLLPPFISLH